LLKLRTLVACGLLVGAPTMAPAQQPEPVADAAITPDVVIEEPSAVIEEPSAVIEEPPAAQPSSLDPVRARFAASLAELDDENARLQGERRELAERMRAAERGSPQADAIDRELVEAITTARQQTHDATRTLYRPSEVPAVDQETGDALPAGARAEALAAAAGLRWRRVEVYGEAMQRLIELRKESARRISDSRRSSLLGFGREGFGQLSRELAQVRVTLELYLARRRHSIDEVPQMARDVFTIGSALTHLVLAILVIVTAVWARSRWRGWLEQLRSSLFRSLSSVRWKRRLQRLLGAVQVVAPSGLFLLTLGALRWAMGAAADTIEAQILFAPLVVFGVYRLAVDAAAASLLSVAVHFGLAVSDERRSKLLSSVRNVLRIGAAMVLILLVSRGAGQGYLSSLVVKFAWIVILAAVIGELFRWRREMVGTFLNLQPEGRLAAVVRQSRDRWYGVFVAPAAFIWLAGRAAATVAREFALGFEQTQKALAYVFRRQVERRAELEGYAEGDVTELPREVVEAFHEDAVERGPLVVDHFPQMRDLHQLLSSWRDTGASGSFLLTGERGIGKTSWLNQIERDDLPIERIVPGERFTDFAHLAARLGDLLEVAVDPDDPLYSLGSALTEGPHRVVVLDMAQHLFLADVGGYGAFAGFARLVNRTCRHVFWLCSMNTYAWRHLVAVRPDAAVFRGSAHLSAWSEERIRELIRARCVASGARFNFADLVVDGVEGVSTQARLIESEEGYTRLLWDYSDGNPRAALHFFLRSLNAERGDRVRVRMFRAPEVDRLEAGGFNGLFVLAAVVTHESISFDHLVEVTRLERPECFIHLDRMAELGAVVCEHELYRVSTTWHRAAVRLLRRRNLLPA
jgi:hypothetical protein